MNEEAKSSGKKSYIKPDLRVYGDIQVLTQGIGMKGQISDALAMTNRKTG